jgi:hypothetical protein
LIVDVIFEFALSDIWKIKGEKRELVDYKTKENLGQKF